MTQPHVIALVTRSGAGGAEVLVRDRPPDAPGLPGERVATLEDGPRAAVRTAARATGFAHVAFASDLGPAPGAGHGWVVQLHPTRRPPERWWLLVDDDPQSTRCSWLPVADALRHAWPDSAGRVAGLARTIAAGPGPRPCDLPPLFDDTLLAPGAEHIAWQDRWLLERWRPGPAEGVPARAQAFTVTGSGDAVLVSTYADLDVWGLPGGGIEPGESPLDALARELDEEACARLVATEPLGCYELVEPLAADGPERTLQAKYWARVELEPFDPRFEVRRRRLVPLPHRP